MPGLYIAGTQVAERPKSRCTVFADSTADQTFREGIDVELSHWLPNRTPAKFKADTSTEICMRFMASRAVDFDLVVNSHADVDGVLAVYTLLHPAAALAHRDVIVSAAEIGDFWGWGDASAQVLCQALTRFIDSLESAVDPQIIYERAFTLVDRLIDRGFIDPATDESLAPLRQSVTWVERGEIPRCEYHSRFVHYVVPAHLSRDRMEAALRIPPFGAAISNECLFWPQARARWDREKVVLVSVEAPGGWYYDVWYPSYLWADTPNSWRAPGLNFLGQHNGFSFAFEPLKALVRELQHREPNDTQWRIETTFSPFSSTPGRGYPVVLSVVNPDRLAPSGLDPAFVADRLASVFDPKS